MKNIEKIRNQMGYSEKPIYEYTEPADDLMDYEGYSPFAQKFNLKKSDILAIEKAMTTSAAHLRSSQKSMMATKSLIIPEIEPKKIKSSLQELDSLIQTREKHMEEVANVAALIANGLGVNADLAYLTGFLHDIGHTWNGHTGERILSAIGSLKNCGYIVHNAMGAYIFERENIIDKTIQQLKTQNPKLDIEEFRRFMQYAIDGIVSHNGEGIIGKIIPKDKTTEQMQEEIKKCFTEKGYDKKIMPATMEGAIIRYADIIAYTRSDILDGFRLRDRTGKKILTDFDDEYLSVIGTCLARRDNNTEMLTLENKFLLEMSALSKRIKELSNTDKPENIEEKQRTEKERELIESKYREFEKEKIKYAKQYLKTIKPLSDVKTQVTDMMQTVFIMDLIETSKDRGYITMSPLIRKTLFLLRDLNVRKIVPYTRRPFESTQLPVAADYFVDLIADSLVETGIAYDAIPEEVKEKCPPTYTKETQKKNQEIVDTSEKLNFERKICHYYRNQKPETIAYMYGNVLEAMVDITKHDIAIALGEEPHGSELRELYESQKIAPIRKRIGESGKTAETMTAEDRKKLLDELLAERLKGIERAIASKMAIEYVGGMTDKTILIALLDKNIISVKDLLEGYERLEPGQQLEDFGVRKLQNTFSGIEDMINDDDLYIKRKPKDSNEEQICL